MRRRELDGGAGAAGKISVDGAGPPCGACRPDARRWLGSFDEVPEFQRRDFIYTSYRLEEPRMRHFWRLHNESGNIWTHVLAGFYMCVRFNRWMSGEDLPWSTSWPRNAYAWGIIAYYMASIFVFGISVQYHWRMCSPERAFLCWRCLDQSACLAVVILGFVSGIPLGFHCDEHLRFWYSVLSVAVCMFRVLGVTLIPKRHSGAISAVIIAGAMAALIPALHWLIISRAGRRVAGADLAATIVLASVATFVFAKMWPESSFPGRFDLVGSSHQIWHVLIFGVIVKYGDCLTTVFALTGDRGSCP